MEKKWWHNKVAYQIYPKSFCDSNGDGIGDLQGIISKLDYLKELGIDILWLSPVYKSPMVDQGYDISDYYNIDPMFGTMEDMDMLLSEAKKRGIYILMDLVINHCSDKHEWFQKALEDPDGKYADYFYIKEGKDGKEPCNWRSYFGGSAWEKIGDTNKYYLHFFAKEQPDLNWENKEVREELYKMINWWLEKGVDGFRIDAIINIKKQLEFKDYEPDGEDGLCSLHPVLAETEGIDEFLKELKIETFQKHDAFTVAEVFDDKEGELELFIGEDGYFSTIFDFTVEKGRTGDSWHDSPKLSAEDIKKLIFKGQEESQEVGFRANILENHDEPRSATVWFEEENVCDAGVKMIGTISMFLRGIPFIYQGQEIGMKNMKFTNIDEVDDVSSKDQYQIAKLAGLSEEEAMKVISYRSRDNGRTPFQWNAQENAGFTTGTPWLMVNPNYVDINMEKQCGDEDSILSYYKKLVALRKNPELEDIFVYGKFEKAYAEEENIFAYYRKADTRKILVIANFQNKEKEMNLTDEIGEVLLSNMKDSQISGTNIKLRPYEVLVCMVK